MGNFSKTCRNIQLNGTVLQAECQRRDGSFVSSSIDLNSVISNQDGLLDFRGDKFAFSCSNITLSNNVLSARCKKRNGSETSSSIDLNDGISNIDGVLRED